MGIAAAESPPADGQADPHFGLYGVEPDHFPEIAAVGFDVVHSYRFETSSPDSVGSYVDAVREYLDAARTHALRVLVGLPRSWILSRDARKMRTAIETLCHHPAILAWYEEELGQQGHVEEVELLGQLIEAVDPDHGLILEEGRRPSKLIDVGRRRMFTYYPVSRAARKRGQIPSIVDRFPTARLRVPFWPVLQAFGQDLIAGHPKQDLALPTQRELQYTLYSAAVHGATGVFFYTYRHPRRFDAGLKKAGKWPFVDYDTLPRVSPEAWKSVLAVLAEARFLLSRTARAGRPNLPVSVVDQAWLESAQWGSPNENLVVFANRRYEARAVRITVPTAYKSWAVLQAAGLGSPQSIQNGTVTVEVPGPGGVVVVFER